MSSNFKIAFGVSLVLLVIGTAVIFGARDVNGWNHFSGFVAKAFDQLYIEALASDQPSTEATGDSSGDSADGKPEDTADWDVELSSTVPNVALPEFDAGKVAEFKAKGDWCTSHNVPESMCIMCNPDLIPRFKGTGDWCAGHGVPESLCTSCNRKLADLGIGFTTPQTSGTHDSGSPETLTKEKLQEFRAKGDWCTEHNIPESLCTKCNQQLAAEYKAKGDWCAEHKVPDSLCPDCKPAIAALGIGRDWCEKHNLPESQCVFCHPELALSKSQLAIYANDGLDLGLSGEGILKSLEMSISQHLPIVVEPMDEPDQRLGINPNCHLHGTQILFASPEVAGEVGIAVVDAKMDLVTESLPCYGEVQYNKSRFVWLSSRAPGIVESVQGDLGDSVKKGQVVAIIDSAELGEAKATLLRAHSERNRWSWVTESYESSNGSGAISRKDLVEAKAALAGASIEVDIAAQKLRNYGLDGEMLEQIVENHNTSTLLPVMAPFDSTVVELKAVPGEVIERGGPIFALADTSTMWAMLDIFVRDLPKVKEEMPVVFSPDGLDGQVFHGKVDWIGSQLDEKTRTAKVRAILHNHDGQIRSGLFGKGEIALHQNDGVLTVPRESVQWDGCCNVVFVKKSDVLYQPRKIRIGYATDDNYVVEAGLIPGERIVTTGSYLLKTEILKGSIGAGCTCGG